MIFCRSQVLSEFSTDELIAFFQLKSAMVDMLKRGHFEQFREGIRYILEGWQSRTTVHANFSTPQKNEIDRPLKFRLLQQNIRASRFSIALNLLSESGVLASTGTSTSSIHPFAHTLTCARNDI